MWLRRTGFIASCSLLIAIATSGVTIESRRSIGEMETSPGGGTVGSSIQMQR